MEIAESVDRVVAGGSPVEEARTLVADVLSENFTAPDFWASFLQSGGLRMLAAQVQEIFHYLGKLFNGIRKLLRVGTREERATWFVERRIKALGKLMLDWVHEVKYAWSDDAIEVLNAWSKVFASMQRKYKDVRREILGLKRRQPNVMVKGGPFNQLDRVLTGYMRGFTEFNRRIQPKIEEVNEMAADWARRGLAIPKVSAVDLVLGVAEGWQQWASKDKWFRKDDPFIKGL